jgi:hypothetical protein
MAKKLPTFRKKQKTKNKTYTTKNNNNKTTIMKVSEAQ